MGGCGCGFVEGLATFDARGVVSFDGVEFVRGLGVGGVAGSINPRAAAALGSGIVLHVNGSAVDVDVGVFDNPALETEASFGTLVVAPLVADDRGELDRAG